VPRNDKGGFVPAQLKPYHVKPSESSGELARQILVLFQIQTAPGRSRLHSNLLQAICYCTVTLTGVEAMPFAITTRLLVPVSAVKGTSKVVETIFGPVATPMLLWLWVRA